MTAFEIGRTIPVRVNNRGPFMRGRIIDLSRDAAELPGIRAGTPAPVRVRVAEPDERDRAGLRKGKAAAARPDAYPETRSILRTALNDRLSLP